MHTGVSRVKLLEEEEEEPAARPLKRRTMREDITAAILTR